MVSFKGAHFLQEIMRTGVRWSVVAYPMSPHYVEALLLERGVHGNHSAMHRWASRTARSSIQPCITASGPRGVGWSTGQGCAARC